MQTWAKYTLGAIGVIALIAIIKKMSAANAPAPMTLQKGTTINPEGTINTLGIPYSSGHGGKKLIPICPSGGTWVPLGGGIGYCRYISAI